MPSAIMECSDFSEFQDALKNMRKLDDIIVNTMNTIIPTDSFKADGTGACKQLRNDIDSGNTQRESAIKKCITLSAERVHKLKQQREENTSDILLSKNLRAEQTKLRMLQVELSVEELIRERTAKVFNERCRKFLKE